MTYTAKECRHAIVDAALDAWASDVRDFDDGQEPTPERIEAFVRRIGWKWILGDDGAYQEHEAKWCGIYIGACAMQIGEYLAPDRCVDATLKPSIADHVMPSCDRLASDDQWAKAGVQPAQSVRPDALVRGDIATVGSGRNGSHIVLIRDRSGESYRTVEGNATGRLPGGSWGEGVVQQTRTVAEIVRAYRLTDEHFVGEGLK